MVADQKKDKRFTVVESVLICVPQRLTIDTCLAAIWPRVIAFFFPTAGYEQDFC
jgi:hypothetical protein